MLSKKQKKKIIKKFKAEKKEVEEVVARERKEIKDVATRESKEFSEMLVPTNPPSLPKTFSGWFIGIFLLIIGIFTMFRAFTEGLVFFVFGFIVVLFMYMRHINLKKQLKKREKK